MYIALTTFNVVTAIMVGLTVWLAFWRYNKPLESNWPLFYYLALVIYSKAFAGALDPYWVFTGVVSALLLRFEFMGGAFLKFVQGVEYVVLAYFAWRGCMLILT